MHATASAQLHVHIVNDIEELLNAGDLSIDATTEIFALGGGKQIHSAGIIREHSRAGQRLVTTSTTRRFLKAIWTLGRKACSNVGEG